jgi:hypothetical protein
MDDFNLSTLHDCKAEWASRVLIILTPLIIEGLRDVFNEANNLCLKNDEPEKYLMTFQNFLLQIPKWSNTTVEVARKQIVERSGCTYLQDLVTCVHITQLKILTAMRVGTKQKKINIEVPKLDDFIHKVYVNVARKVYNNVYLYETQIAPLQVQKNYRELEIIVQECILNTIRQSIPVDTILRAYMDETIEEEVTEEIQKEELQPEELEREAGASATATSAISALDDAPTSTNPELNELRDMQKVLSEEPELVSLPEPTETSTTAFSAVRGTPPPTLDVEPLEVDLTPLSRPASVENLPFTETENSGIKLSVDTSPPEPPASASSASALAKEEEEISIDFESL